MTTWRVQIRDQYDVFHDVFLDAEPGTPSSRLADEVAALGFRAQPVAVDDTRCTDVEDLEELDLAHGDVITTGRIDRPTPPPGAGRYVVVVCGPDSGHAMPVATGGSIVVGRTGAADLVLSDELLSARHCRITVDDQGCSVVDQGSTNGTFVEGDEIHDETRLEPGAFVQVGSSVLTVVEVAPSDLAVVASSSGPDQAFPRQYRRAETPFPSKVDPPRKPSDTRGAGGTMWWRALLPVVSGIGFAAITGRWIFLLVVLVAPIVIGVDAFRRKRRRDRDAVEADETYRRELDEYRDRVRRLRAEERRRRRATSQCGGAALLASATRHRRLWERSPGDDDFVSVPVGLGAMPSAIGAEDPDDRLDPLQWGTPVETSLLVTGSLGIVGDAGVARAAGRSIIMNLAANHSPANVRLWLVTRDVDGSDWGFIRWLPHTYQGTQASTIAASDLERASLVKALKQLIDTRAEAGDRTRDAAPLPIHVVVVDGIDLLAPEELTDLLRRGPELGVVAITIDERLAPEGAGATLTLDRVADLAVFDSRHQPRTEGIIVPRISNEVAGAASRRMAALRPSLDGRSGSIGGEYHLVDIESLAGLSAADLAARWSELSPHLVATVGMSSEIPMHVDLVRDGPHGLIGGTSGSGKTEFLKTMFVSLCLNNHPDDLSIVVVDFKGGVDHDAIRPLPHVVDVATNLDIAQFERTIAMLDAEQKRRQALLASAGANNVVSYREARRARPDLPPLPRLVVVVDEFGELLAAEGGREKLRELESITRIGRALGLHLLLVTQNFEGNLPGQIDANAGLRISLRVQKPAHSKAVLDSGVAVSIPDDQVGRAYARFHGRELIEFQTARVAGRRRDLEPEAAGAELRLAPFSTLAVAPPERRSGDVPNEETDMYTLVERCREAAALTGWTRSAVPWPAALPEHVSVSSLLQHHDGDGVPIGLADLPSEQRRDRVAVSPRATQQLAVIGGSATPVPEVLTTYGASLALGSDPDGTHLYGIDLLGSSLSQLAELPQCGGVAVRNEQLSLRIVRWLLDEAATRKVAMAATGSSTIWQHAEATGERRPQLVLLVSGADRLLSTDDGAFQNLRGPLTSLMSEAIGVGIQIVLGGLPKIVHSRLGANVTDRLVLGLADVGEYTGLGVDRSVATQLQVTRRAVQLPGHRVVQLAQLAPPGTAEGTVIQRLAGSMEHPTPGTLHRFVDVPWPLPWDAAVDGRPWAPPAAFLAPLPIAIDTNTGEWTWIDAVDDGPVFAIAGPPKSGRSTMLAAMARLAVQRGWEVVNATTSRRSPLTTSTDPALARRCRPEALGAELGSVAGHCLVVIDDLQRLESADGIDAALEHRDRVLVAVAAPPDFLSSRTGLMRNFPAFTAGALLAPPGALDGSAVGLRRLPPELTADPRPGRGILAIAGEPTEIQVPLVPSTTREAGATAPDAGRGPRSVRL